MTSRIGTTYRDNGDVIVTTYNEKGHPVKQVVNGDPKHPKSWQKPLKADKFGLNMNYGVKTQNIK